MTIRALGALLSTYQRLEKLPSDTRDQARALKLPGKVDVKKHAPKILELAKDLARRLLPAFSSPTGLPYARVNLRKGVEKGESTETCSAGAGSLILEFTLLSRITGDSTYEVRVARSTSAAAKLLGAQPSRLALLTPDPRAPRIHGDLEPPDRPGPRRQPD